MNVDCFTELFYAYLIIFCIPACQLIITYDGVYIVFVELPYNGLVPSSVSLICRFLFLRSKFKFQHY